MLEAQREQTICSLQQIATNTLCAHAATIDLVAAAMGTVRRRVDQLRDNIVFRGAMYAIEEQLFRLEDGEDRKEHGA